MMPEALAIRQPLAALGVRRISFVDDSPDVIER